MKQQRPPQGFKGKRGSDAPSGASRTSGPKSAGAGQFQKPSPRFIERETSRYDNPWRGRDAKAQANRGNKSMGGGGINRPEFNGGGGGGGKKAGGGGGNKKKFVPKSKGGGGGASRGRRR